MKLYKEVYIHIDLKCVWSCEVNTFKLQNTQPTIKCSGAASGTNAIHTVEK